MKHTFYFLLRIVMISFIVHSYLLAQKITPFTTDDGLVDNTVYSIFEDDSDYLWVGTNGGLGRYDGTGWEKFTQTNSQLVNNKVNTILQDNDGHLWFGTNDGISEFYDNHWETYTHHQMPAYIRAEHITVLFLDTKSNIWIGTKGGGVTKRFRNTQGIWEWKPYDTGNSNIISDYITAINEDSLGNIWIGTMNSGICKFDENSNWISFSDHIEFIGSKINAIFKDHSNALWICSNNGVFRTYDGTHWFSIGPIPTVQSIAEDREGNLWLGTQNDGLYKYDHINCYKPPIKGIENVPTISSMIRDQNGYLWLGTNGAGVIRLHLNWQMFNKNNSGLVNNIITSIDEDTSANLWIATSNSGIARFNGLEFDTFNVDGSLYGTNFVNSIMVDKNNWVWCATDVGVHGFDGITNNWISYIDSLPHEIVNTLIQDNEGNYWFCTWGGVSRFDGNLWASFDVSNGFPGKIITTAWEDNTGHLWFGTSDGGVCEFYNDSVLAIYDTSNGLINNNVTTIIQDKHNAFWFGTSNGISRFDGMNWENFTTDNSGLTNNNIKCFHRDNNDNIWIGTAAGGLIKFDGQFWIDFSEHFISDAVNVIFQNSNENLWFGTTSGLLKYSPDKIAPETFITIAPDSIIGERTTLFGFSGIDTETPKDKLVYTWSLSEKQSGYIYNWCEYTSTNFCNVHFPSNGYYTFSVKAKDEDGNVDPIPNSINFIVDTTPPKTFIINPVSNEIISGTVKVIGTAFDTTSIIKDFKYYWLSYARGDSLEFINNSDWCNIFPDQASTPCLKDTFFITTPIINKKLISWNTNGLYGDYFLRLSAKDTLDHPSYYAVKVKIVENLSEIIRNAGGTIELPNKIQLYVPPGAMDRDIEIYFSPIQVNRNIPVSNDEIKFSSLAFFIGPDTINLNKPATFSMHYSDEEITGLNELKLSLMYIDSTISDLDKTNFSLNQINTANDTFLIGGVVNSDNNIIRTAIRKFGAYILIEDNRAREGNSYIKEIDCQPRIFSPMGTGFSTTTKISFKLTNHSTINIKIYNLAGRLVRILLENRRMRAGSNSVEWDGRDYSGNICPSDLYIISIENKNEVKTKTVMILDKS